MSERFNVLMCKFYVYAVVGIIIEYFFNQLINSFIIYENVVCYSQEPARVLTPGMPILGTVI